MLIRTHIAIVIFFILFFVPLVENQAVFVLITLVATFLPDIDSRFSKLGQRKIFRPLQFFVKHRDFFHSFTFLFLITLFFALFWPIAALPFFLGYGIHLLADSFTVEGIKPFYPYRKTSSWRVRTGRRLETSLFVFFVLADLFMLVWVVSSIF
jgi:inner membrane protein